MQDDKFKIFNYAMHYGVALGFFWIFKYLFLIGSIYYVPLIYIYNFLSVGTCVLLYYLGTLYRDKVNGGKIGYFEFVTFTVLLCFFASLIEAVVAYIHYTMIDPTFVTSINKALADFMVNIKMPKEAISEFEANPFGPIKLLFMQGVGNLFSGLVLSLLYGLVIIKNDKRS